MNRGLSESGQTTALVLVGLMLMAIPAGLAVTQGLSTTDADQSTIPTVTPPSLTLPTPTATPTDTATETPTPTPTPMPDDNNTDGTDSTDGDGTTGQTHFVNTGGGVADNIGSNEGCSAANYTTIQAAVDDAESGDTVVVCPGTYPEHVEVTTADLTIRANGNAAIENAGKSAVWINASGVTLQGFNISVGEGANYAIEVGGQETVIKDNSISSSGIGIFLSDGRPETGECRTRHTAQYYVTECDENPPVDPGLGAATKGRVVNNSVTANHFRIWVDADQTVIRNNFVTDRRLPTEQTQSSEQVNTGLTFTMGHEDRVFCQGCENYNTSIVSSGNETIIRENTVHPSATETGRFWYHEAGIQAGKTPRQGHNKAQNNLIASNSVIKPYGKGIKLRKGSSKTIVRRNTITKASTGIEVFDGAVIRNNTITRGPDGVLGGGVWVMNFHEEGKEAVIINNTISNTLLGVSVMDQAKLIGNTITNVQQEGVEFRTCSNMDGAGRMINNQITGSGYYGVSVHVGGSEGGCPAAWNNRVDILHNQITDNRQNGINIHEWADPSQIKIHGNIINNNQDLGIHNANTSVIVDATNNIWDCGGPSGGFNPLADPYTGRLANGSGDTISVGNGSMRNGHPISNVHFDPFQELSSCPNQTSTPTPTPTPPATPTQTPPPGTEAGDDAHDTGEDVGDGGTGGTDGDGPGSGDGDGSDATGGDSEAGGDQTRPPPSSLTATPTATSTPPETPTPTDTPTPTPVVEPGFGVLTWLVGFILSAGLLALRRWEVTHD